MPGGKAPQKGEIFKNPLLANTLEKIVKGGRNEFYRGSIARNIDIFMKKQGGFLTFDDMSRHHSEWVEPVSYQLIVVMTYGSFLLTDRGSLPCRYLIFSKDMILLYGFWII